MPPKVLAKSNDRAGGVLPVSGATRAATAKAPTARLKLEIRRLPPGLTLTEFEEILGPEWKLGNGKVDWREYRQGKMKMAIGKVPEQSRCYIHLVSEPLVKEFEARFLQVVFHDKAGTHKNLELRHLPPTVGFAPNQRTPITAKTKVDPRQGTIDQDPEFIRFLEAETQPITKPAALDAVGVEKEKVEKSENTSTPLIEAIREKKANKAKAAAAKEEKREGKGHSKSESKDPASVKGNGKEGKTASTQKVEQASKEASKAVNKHVATKQQQQRPASPQQVSSKIQSSPAKSKKSLPSNKSQTTETTTGTTSSSGSSQATGSSQRSQRTRGNPEAIKKIFQKDLGLKPNTSAVSRETSSQASRPAQVTSSDTANSTTTPTKSQTTAQPNKAQASAKAQTGPKQQSQTSNASAVFRAYVKHANPSQGITDTLLKQALAPHGEVTSVSIDTRKGTAVVNFKTHEGLRKALDAKRVDVAGGTIEVLEFRDRNASSSNKGGAKSGRGSNRSGKGSNQQTSAAASASVAEPGNKAKNTSSVP